jgi:NAD(P)-dependent dehydrogenase (short-subunit alcohol dehydrogenase family)
MSGTEPLRGRTALVTGASGGLGSEIARTLGAAGCRLVLTGRDDAKLAHLGRDLSAQGRAAEWIAADLRDARECEVLAERAQAAVGAVDVLVNAAGVFQVSGLAASRAEDFDALFALNVRAPFLLARALAPGMAERGWGRIVHIGSSSSYEGFANTSLYCASKHALLGLSRSLYREWRGRNVRVFCVAPGSIRTPMGREVPGQDWNTFLDPAEVAAYVAFVIAFDGAAISEEVRVNRVERDA